MPKDSKFAKDDSESEEDAKAKHEPEPKLKKPTGKDSMVNKDMLKAFFGS